jgi:hypothetical protein
VTACFHPIDIDLSHQTRSQVAGITCYMLLFNIITHCRSPSSKRDVLRIFVGKSESERVAYVGNTVAIMDGYGMGDMRERILILYL